jgi:hypothetical protein
MPGPLADRHHLCWSCEQVCDCQGVHECEACDACNAIFTDEIEAGLTPDGEEDDQDG